ncbi:hypothetical protein Tcan_04913 [Toxocara canis]|uniref:Snake toxin/toxin-like domain-containing protein n=1 Tax=Toxocara canis TaxID=6265 RepID=A0A0B2VQR9_TOXCA|nr:hypothetical protein Tcan_04913 [Toxocara canis]
MRSNAICHVNWSTGVWDVVILILLTTVSCCEALNCYSCSYSMLEPTPENDDFFCGNETLVLLEKDLTVKPCAPWEKFCITTVETSLKAFSAVVRTCAETCNQICESDGYGTDMVRCDDCCTTDMCNGNYTVRYYLQLMARQYTSWIEPLPGERAYNKANGMKFPY